MSTFSCKIPANDLQKANTTTAEFPDPVHPRQPRGVLHSPWPLALLSASDQPSDPLPFRESSGCGYIFQEDE